MTTARTALTDEDFGKLVRGEIISKTVNGEVIEICLQDIGWPRMGDHIDAAVHEHHQKYD